MNLSVLEEAVASRTLPLARAAKHSTLMALLNGATVAGFGFDVQAKLLKRTHRDLRKHLVPWVRTSAVTHWSMPDRWPRPYRSEFIIDGDWDLENVGDLEYYLQNSMNYRTVWQIFSEHRPYEESDQYQFLAGLIRDRGWHPEIDQRGRTIAEVQAYFADLAKLFESIRLDGIHSQAELGIRDAGFDEIRVMIDRHGRIVRTFGGNHRFAMAQILGIPHIPVYVLAVHRLWARQWFESVEGGLAVAITRGLDALPSAPPV